MSFFISKIGFMTVEMLKRCKIDNFNAKSFLMIVELALTLFQKNRYHQAPLYKIWPKPALYSMFIFFFFFCFVLFFVVVFSSSNFLF